MIIPELETAVSSLLESFLTDKWKSKPLGFYTWNPELSRIFQQDRFLQEDIYESLLPVLIDTLASDTVLRTEYINIVDLVAKITNPFTKPSLAPYVISSQSGYPQGDLPFFPGSISPEIALLGKLIDDEPGPGPGGAEFNLMEKIIEQLRLGKMSLKPTTNSGWYDHCLWAIEALVTLDTLVESSKIQFGNRYRECLLDLFRGAYCLTRETHVKQLSSAWGCGGGMSFPPRINIDPEFSIEPLPTVYLRRLYAYQFIEDILVASFGQKILEKSHRLTETGLIAKGLMEELFEMKSIFYGAYLVTCQELGLEPCSVNDNTGLESERAISVYRSFAAGLTRDADLGQDARCMVPIYYDPNRRLMKVWTFLGWRKRELNVGYVTPPLLNSLDTSGFTKPEQLSHLNLGNYKPEISFGSRSVQAAYPAMAEFYVEQPMNRNHFRNHCNRHGTETAILRSFKVRVV